MDKFVVTFVSFALFVGGVWMLIWPEAAERTGVEANRPGQPTALATMRAAGMVFIAGGIYALYAVWSGMRGAEFFPV